MIRRQHSRVSGSMLLECLALMAGLSAGMAVGGLALILTLRTERIADEAFTQLMARRALAEQFRTDVNRATGTLDQAALGDEQAVVASPTCLILRGPGKHQVIYRWASRQLERIEVKAGETITQALPLGPRTAAVELVCGSGKNPLITLKLREEAPARGGPEPTFELAAALGGEWR